MDLFIFNLLCKRKRRLYILSRWHTSKCMEGESVVEIFANFCSTILYEPLYISFHKDYIRLFKHQDFLKIPYTWLQEQDQKQFIQDVIKNRGEYFERTEIHLSGAFLFSQCKCNPKWKIEHRREFLRDLLFMTITHKEYGQYFREYVWIRVFQTLMLNPKTDRFIREAHHALQGRNDIFQILCWYPLSGQTNSKKDGGRYIE